MTGKELFDSLFAGGAPSPRPVLSWPCPDQATGDAIIRKLDQPFIAESGQLLLAQIYNPFGQTIRQGVNWREAMAQGPAEGGALLDLLQAQVAREIEDAADRGADGIFYVLSGACPAWTTPMEYGGYFLERDRELLSAAMARPKFRVFLFISGDAEVYFDFVGDLPASAFGWDQETTSVEVDAVRALRSGVLFSAGPGAEIELVSKPGSIAQTIEKPKKAS